MRRWAPAASLFLALAALMLVSSRAPAGPPFVTDDPEPVEWHHWEVYISSIYQNATGGISGTLPHLEVNHGIVPNVQLHLILPNAFSNPGSGATQYGLGDTELGVKYRFLQENKTTPQAGIFPLLEVPTGASSRGLGSGYLQAFLPLWIQKSWGLWTSYGGGGYWIHPGAGNKNYWLVGWLLQKDLNAHWTFGGELFYTTPSVEGGRDQVNFNLGGYYNFDEGHHLLFSAGRSLSGDTTFMAYVGYQWTFGPNERTTPGHEERPHG